MTFDLFDVTSGSTGHEIPIEIERDQNEWKIFFTLKQIGQLIDDSIDQIRLSTLAESLNILDRYQLIVTTQNEERLFNIHCVAEETDIFRNGGIDDITRLIVDQTKLQGNNVNVIVKGL